VAPTPTTPTTNGPWTTPDESQVKQLINQALADNGGDVSKAFAELRDRRQQPANYYDSNLAIAADYLRARWETQRCGPGVAEAEVDGYLALKQTTGVPQEGPGPVSPYTSLEDKYMHQGVQDEANKMSFWDKLWWASPPGQLYGLAQAGWGVLRGEEG
jgi:hypothetical protein